VFIDPGYPSSFSAFDQPEAALKRTMLLRFAALHPEGLRFSQLQRFVVELNGLNYDTFDVVRVWRNNQLKMGRRRRHRGYWCDYLCDVHTATGFRQGILTKYFKKKNDLYVLNKLGYNIAYGKFGAK